MKRLTAIILAITLALTLAACSDDRVSQEEYDRLQEEYNRLTEGNDNSEANDNSGTSNTDAVITLTSEFTLIKFEINPSFYLFLDAEQKVSDYEPLNGDAQALSFTEIKGLTLGEAVNFIFSQMHDEGLLQDDEVRVTVITDNNDSSAYETVMRNQIAEFAQENELILTVTFIAATEDDQAEYSIRSTTTSTSEQTPLESPWIFISENIYEYTDGDGTLYRYEGEVHNGKPNGAGMYYVRPISSDGSYVHITYAGNFVDGLLHGDVIHTYKEDKNMQFDTWEFSVDMGRTGETELVGKAENEGRTFTVTWELSGGEIFGIPPWAYDFS